eukprot:TRINITY_DN361_c0_g1_i1.p1 TRINITY_DN361_c0_g1~~TRINITY_DN361_c0_g1_i1.p1  ORF type:complete len:193 (-),score=27.30 TRINITY_DN361_c0_g1_i1:61-579(-)
MASQMLLSFLAVLCLCFGLAQGKGVVVFKAGEQQIGIYFRGRQDVADSGLTDQQPAAYEVFLGTVAPHEMFATQVNDFDAFDIRAADMMARTRVITYTNSDGKAKFDHPHKVSFRNIMQEGAMVELEHGNKEYIWIQPGHQLTHATSPSAFFHLRASGKLFASVMLDMPNEL